MTDGKARTYIAKVAIDAITGCKNPRPGASSGSTAQAEPDDGMLAHDLQEYTVDRICGVR